MLMKGNLIVRIIVYTPLVTEASVDEVSKVSCHRVHLISEDSIYSHTYIVSYHIVSSVRLGGVY